jgi:hypothetical protein
MKAFEELEVKLHSFLTLAVEGGIFIRGISEVCKDSGSQGCD